MTATAERTDAHCPHCLLLVEAAAPAPWPPQPVRCPHCRLLIGVGRAREAGDGAPGARGAAAGVFAREAQRARTAGEVAGDASPDEVVEGIRAVAEQLGSPPERLLMVDYQQRAAEDENLPDLTDVFAAFGSWKRARREAADGGASAAA
jgi:hypothetical protein